MFTDSELSVTWVADVLLFPDDWPSEDGLGCWTLLQTIRSTLVCGPNVVPTVCELSFCCEEGMFWVRGVFSHFSVLVFVFIVAVAE
jgi:hypothetical protein